MYNIYVDLDNTLCRTISTDYEGAIPIYNRIHKINELYKNHTITIYTARGSNPAKRQYITELTKSQLEKWGVLYHHLSVGEKPIYDFLIDDRNLTIEQLDNEHFLDFFRT